LQKLHALHAAEMQQLHEMRSEINSDAQQLRSEMRDGLLKLSVMGYSSEVQRFAEPLGQTQGDYQEMAGKSNDAQRLADPVEQMRGEPREMVGTISEAPRLVDTVEQMRGEFRKLHALHEENMQKLCEIHAEINSSPRADSLKLRMVQESSQKSIGKNSDEIHAEIDSSPRDDGLKLRMVQENSQKSIGKNSDAHVQPDGQLVQELLRLTFQLDEQLNDLQTVPESLREQLRDEFHKLQDCLLAEFRQEFESVQKGLQPESFQSLRDEVHEDFQSMQERVLHDLRRELWSSLGGTPTNSSSLGGTPTNSDPRGGAGSGASAPAPKLKMALPRALPTLAEEAPVAPYAKSSDLPKLIVPQNMRPQDHRDDEAMDGPTLQDSIGSYQGRKY